MKSSARSILTGGFGFEVLLISGLLGFQATAPAAPPERPEASPGARDRQVEADWLRQAAVRGSPPRRGDVTAREDAAGGCDGLKNGLWGFHTGHDESPWWQVDLGSAMPLERVVIYNRCDGATERALRLAVLLSGDGKAWTESYRHDGSLFRGFPDGKPLSVPLNGNTARYVRIQLPGREFLHLDEVEVYRSDTWYHGNVALGRPADQSSASQWSKRSPVILSGAAAKDGEPLPRPLAAEALERGRKLAAGLRRLGAGVDREIQDLEEAAEELKKVPEEGSAAVPRSLFLKIRGAARRLAFANPLLDFDRLLFTKRVPTSFSHMSDQNYGWFSRPGGGLFLLEGWKGGAPRLVPLTAGLPPGNLTEPELSHDGTRVLFAYAQYRAGVAEEPNKLDKSNVPEEAFYHLYEMSLDGTGLRRLTRGKYDDFNGRYLPSGEIVFLSTRRGKFVQCNRSTALSSCAGDQPDSYVRCGGGPERPVAVYTLHVMGPNGENVRTISPFENFEWNPSVAADGRILYARWDYVDRNNMPYMSLWSCLPDGTSAQAVFGNYTINPYSIFEAQGIPGSRRLIFTASAHHSITGGSLVLLDPGKGVDGPGPMTRLTPEVPFPEVEGWPSTYFVNPHPLSEEFYLVSWSDQPLAPGWPQVNPPNALGLYLFDAFGNLELIYRDPEISSMHPIPVRPRPKPADLASTVQWEARQEGQLLLLNAYQGLEGIAPGSVNRLRIIGVPAKTHPTMNHPPMGITHDDPGKFVLGTVPVEPDGSAYFSVPSGVPFFLQALDAEGLAIQTMRSVAYVQPGQTYSCVGCHEPRTVSPVNARPLAAQRPPSKIAPGPEGSWPLDFAALVGPVLEKRCASCHQPGASAEKIDLRPQAAYQALVTWGKESLRELVLRGYRDGQSRPGGAVARTSALWKLLQEGHYGVELSREDQDRLATWMDTYAQATGSFSREQEKELRELRERLRGILEVSQAPR